MWSRILNEPVLLGTVIRAGILLGTAFGLNWTAEQIAVTMAFVEAVMALITRAVVTPNKLAEARVDAGVRPTDSRTLAGLALIVTLGLSGTLGCAKAPPTLSPQGTAAFHATRVVKGLGVLQDFAIAAESQNPKVLSTANTRIVVTFVGASVRVIDQIPDGWKPAVNTGLQGLERDLSPEAWTKIAPYINLLRVLIAEVP